MKDAGDPWQAWLHGHAPALLLFARQWAPTQADAEDVVQEAFLRFWRARDRANHQLAYLYACVKSVALERQRGQARRTRREGVVARAEGVLFDCPLEHDERRLAIEEALERLPADQREVVVLRIWGELTFPQIAAALEIPMNTASSRYRYALASLRERLGKEVVP